MNVLLSCEKMSDELTNHQVSADIWMGLAAQFHWFKGSALVNINGGHSEGYIRNAGLGSVPKIAKLAYFLHYLSDPSG